MAVIPAVSSVGVEELLIRQIHETNLLTCSCVIGWWTIGRKALGGRNLGSDLVIECYAKIQFVPPRIVGLPGGDRQTRHDRYAHLDS